jgi:hypothetical protein
LLELPGRIMTPVGLTVNEIVPPQIRIFHGRAIDGKSQIYETKH